MKTTTIIVALLAFSMALAATVEETAATPIDKITPENVEAVVDACIETSNYNKPIFIASHGKTTGEAIASKFVAAKVPLAAQYSLLDYLMRNTTPAQTNYAAKAIILDAIDFAKLETAKDTEAAINIVKFPSIDASKLYTSEEGIALVKKVYANNNVLGAALANMRFHPEFGKSSAEYKTFATQAYNETKNSTIHNGYELACFIYTANALKDYAQIQVFAARKDLIMRDHLWIYPASSKPEFKTLNENVIAYLKTMSKSANKYNSNILYRFSRALDEYNGDKKATDGIFSFIYNSSMKLKVAMYLDDVDKILETFTTCDTKMDAKDIESVLPAINALDPNYKPAEVITALKAVNQRYTLKLYDDRDTWEPVLSKIRAMIDCR